MAILFEDELEVSNPEPRTKIPDGVYQATLKDVEGREGKFGPCYKLIFGVSYEGKSVEVNYFASQKLSPAMGEIKASNLYIAVCSLENRTLQSKELVKVNGLIGKECRVQIKVDEKSQFSKIISILPTEVK